MPKKIEQPVKVWIKPQLNRLGKIVDVAPGGPGTTEGGSGKS
jgi:hypothetical protein